MPKKSKTKATKAFLDKVKSLNFSTCGSKPPAKQSIIGHKGDQKLEVPLYIIHGVITAKPEKPDDEVSFSA